MLPQEQVQGLIPRINEISIEKIKLQNNIDRCDAEMKRYGYYTDMQQCIKELAYLNSEEEQLREQGKQIMLDNGLKKFEMLDGTVVQLNSSPGALVVAEGVELDKKYYKEKTTITMDKVQVKKDFMEGLILDPGVTIESEYKFIIKQK